MLSPLGPIEESFIEERLSDLFGVGLCNINGKEYYMIETFRNMVDEIEVRLKGG